MFICTKCQRFEGRTCSDETAQLKPVRRASPILETSSNMVAYTRARMTFSAASLKPGPGFSVLTWLHRSGIHVSFSVTHFSAISCATMSSVCICFNTFHSDSRMAWKSASQWWNGPSSRLDGILPVACASVAYVMQRETRTPWM